MALAVYAATHMGRPQRCQAFVVLLVHARNVGCGATTDQANAAVGAQASSVADLPLGCFSYGYQYTPALANVSNPFSAASPVACQRRCAITPGCAYFGYWASNNECWLGGSDAVAVLSKTLGAISGPDICTEHKDMEVCTAIPTAGFPGGTMAESLATWPTRQQPTNLQCWPRKPNGFPATCDNQTATVLQDTLHGWPGRCEGLVKISNLGPTETCQTRCFGSPLCGVWAIENSTSSDGSLTCWQGLFGQNCYDATNGLSPPAGSLFRAQRVMHGTFRVLMNTANMQITNLTQAFGIGMHPDWKEGAKACRMTCLSYLLCQYWQYSDVFGCWVEDDQSNSVGYPLVNDGVAMRTGTYTASTVLAGEYIQHTCRAGPRMPLPTDPPGMAANGGTPPPPHEQKHLPKYGEIGYGSAELGEGTVELTEGSPGFPIWASMLICVTVALCLGVIGAAVWMSLLDAEKRAPAARRPFCEDLEMLPLRTTAAHWPTGTLPSPGQWQMPHFHGMHMAGHPGPYGYAQHPGQHPAQYDPRCGSMFDSSRTAGGR